MLWENTDFTDGAVAPECFASCVNTITASVVGRMSVNRGRSSTRPQIQGTSKRDDEIRGPFSQADIGAGGAISKNG